MPSFANRPRRSGIEEDFRKFSLLGPLLLSETVGKTASDFTGGRGVAVAALNVEEHPYLEFGRVLHAIRQSLEYLLALINGVPCDQHGLLSMGK